MCRPVRAIARYVQDTPLVRDQEHGAGRKCGLGCEVCSPGDVKEGMDAYRVHGLSGGDVYRVAAPRPGHGDAYCFGPRVDA